MRLRALRDACLGGFLYGALLYGAVLSLVHVVHNHLGSARDALIAYAGCLLLYGLWSAAFFALASLVAIPILASGDPRAARAPAGPVRLQPVLLGGLLPLRADLRPGALCIQPASGAWRGCSRSSRSPSPSASALGSWALFRLFAALRRGGGLGWAAVGLFAIGFAAHAAAPLYAGQEPAAKPAKGPPPRIAVADTGLKVIVVGFDGADWRVARPMMDKGRAPHLLRRSSATGRPARWSRSTTPTRP